MLASHYLFVVNGQLLVKRCCKGALEGRHHLERILVAPSFKVGCMLPLQ